MAKRRADEAPEKLETMTEAEATKAPEAAVTQEAQAEPKPADNQPAPAAAQVPTVGRIVHYRLRSGEIRPAIVVNVYGPEVVDLQVFTAGGADRSVIPDRMVTVNVNTGADYHAVPNVVFRPAVTLGDGPGQWSWPPRV